MYYDQKDLSAKKKKEVQNSWFFKKNENAGRKEYFKKQAEKKKKKNRRLKLCCYMLAKKFHLPVQKWLKDKKKKIITKRGNFFIVKISPNGLGFSRFGIIISARTIKKAVRRNYLRRMIFDFIRLKKINFLTPGKDTLIIVQPLVGQAKVMEIKKELKMLLI